MHFGDFDKCRKFFWFQLVCERCLGCPEKHFSRGQPSCWEKKGKKKNTILGDSRIMNSFDAICDVFIQLSENKVFSGYFWL